MRCGLSHLFLLLALSSVLAASFQDCFPPGKLDRFWISPSYASANPNILEIAAIQFYSFDFDNSTASLRLESITTLDNGSLVARLPAEERRQFSGAQASITQAGISLQSAKGHGLAAHSLSLEGQAAPQSALLAAFFAASGTFIGTAQLFAITSGQQMQEYTSLYPQEYSATLESSAEAYDSLNTAAGQVAQMTDGQYALLAKAGAGNAGYSGSAKDTFYYAQSLLSNTSNFCRDGRAQADAISTYFSGKPQLPVFSGFADYILLVGGTGENSSIAQMVSLYSLLKQADNEMEGEYQSALLSADDSKRALSDEIASLGDEQLEKIGDFAFSAQSTGTLVVGASYASIFSGFEKSQDDLATAESAIQSAKGSHASKQADGYLAASIAKAEYAASISENALLSLHQVRSDAETAVYSQKQLSQGKIAEAQQLSSRPASSFSDAKALANGNARLELAQSEIYLAETSKSLGEKFARYANAGRYASEAILAFESKGTLQLLDYAQQQLDSFQSLLDKAKTDGLDVSYEEGKLKDYQGLLDFSPSQDAIDAITGALQSDRQAVLLRLSDKYSYLNDEYAPLRTCVNEIRKTQQSFLPSFNSKVKKCFTDSNQLKAETCAGSLEALGGQISAYMEDCSSEIPSYLSALLSKNAHVLETSAPPVLGMQGDYSAIITTENPTSFDYPGQISFTAATSIPLYAADYSSGDAIEGAYYQDSKTAIDLSGITAGQELLFRFEKQETPAQITYSSDECALAAQDGASVKRQISFFASRSLPSLWISQPAPQSSYGATAKYAGQAVSLATYLSGDSGTLEGRISGVADGKNSLEINFNVLHPFTITASDRTYETLASGAKKVSYELELSDVTVECSSAQVLLAEPSASVSNFTAASLGTGKISGAKAIQSQNSTYLSFTFSPLSAGASQRIAVSYVLTDFQSALASALAQAEFQVGIYNRTKDVLALSQAKSLISQGMFNEALTMLQNMLEDAQSLPGSYADYSLFLQEKSDAAAEIASALSLQGEFTIGNASGAFADLYSLLSKYQSSLAAASDEADFGNYEKALSMLRKGKSDFRTSLAELSYESLSSAENDYAKARKAGGAADALSVAESLISEAQSLYSQAEYTQSFLASAKALYSISALSGASLDSDALAVEQLAQVKANFSSALSEANALLGNYSSQYSVLSSQSKKQMPVTPSAAQGKITDASRKLSSAEKLSDPKKALSGANESLQLLLSARQSLQDSLSSLQSSAASSLSVARVAATEVKAKAGTEDAQAATQIQNELSRAEDFYTNALYADSLVSSDSVIKAANALLAKQSGGIDIKAILLGAISLLFIAAVAYYFLNSQKKKPEGRKREVPKA